MPDLFFPTCIERIETGQIDYVVTAFIEKQTGFSDNIIVATPSYIAFICLGFNLPNSTYHLAGSGISCSAEMIAVLSGGHEEIHSIQLINKPEWKALWQSRYTHSQSDYKDNAIEIEATDFERKLMKDFGFKQFRAAVIVKDSTQNKR